MKRSKYVLMVAGASAAAFAANLITGYAIPYDSAVNPDKLMLGADNFVPLLTGVELGGFLGAKLVMAWFRKIASEVFYPSNKSQLSNPENYIYGPAAASVLKQEIAYGRLVRSTPPGSAPVSRQSFHAATAELMR